MMYQMVNGFLKGIYNAMKFNCFVVVLMGLDVSPSCYFSSA